jgi:hypothetical protein
MDLSVGIFADPIYLGRYNERGQKEDVNNIYQFSEAEWKLVAGSSDLYVASLHEATSRADRAVSV